MLPPGTSPHAAAPSGVGSGRLQRPEAGRAPAFREGEAVNDAEGVDAGATRPPGEGQRGGQTRRRPGRKVREKRELTSGQPRRLRSVEKRGPFQLAPRQLAGTCSTDRSRGRGDARRLLLRARSQSAASAGPGGRAGPRETPARASGPWDEGQVGGRRGGAAALRDRGRDAMTRHGSRWLTHCPSSVLGFCCCVLP